ncbi:lipopolysaccharide export system permease protein LptF [mine drainage metagenome]|uniref:Lipopolysaccharide export system permease protein LptF n=1 Tax=mine drainage metagenome TaxID=410659 RepID=A0A1J5RDU6_9ZZZZ
MIFKRSLLQELFATAFSTFLVLVGIVFAQRIAYYLGFAARGSLATDAISALMGFSMLKFLPMLLSLTIFLSVLLTLTRWHRDSEMVVWFSSGLGLAAWIRPILGFALPVVAVIALMSLFVAPWATEKGAEFRDQLASRDELSAILPGVFKESINADRVYFVESLTGLGSTVKNIFVQSFQHQKLGIMVAQSGYRTTESNGDTFLVMNNGRRYEGTRDTPEYSVTEFERYAIRIEPNEVKPDPPTAKSEPTRELLQKRSSEDNAELQGRLAAPISALVLVLLAIPLSFVDPRAGRSANLIMALLVYIIYNNLLSIMQAWVAQGKLSPLIGLWPIHAAVLALAAYLFYRRLFLLPLLPRLMRG